MPHVVYWTNKPQSKAEISGTHKIYKIQRTPIGLCTAHPKQQTRIQPHQEHHDLIKTYQPNFTVTTIRATIYPDISPKQATYFRTIHR